MCDHVWKESVVGECVLTVCDNVVPNSCSVGPSEGNVNGATSLPGNLLLTSSVVGALDKLTCPHGNKPAKKVCVYGPLFEEPCDSAPNA